MVVMSEMYTVTQVQILRKVIWISYTLILLEKVCIQLYPL